MRAANGRATRGLAERVDHASLVQRVIQAAETNVPAGHPSFADVIAFAVGGIGSGAALVIIAERLP
jgi:hypothetical protein